MAISKLFGQPDKNVSGKEAGSVSSRIVSPRSFLHITPRWAQDRNRTPKMAGWKSSLGVQGGRRGGGAVRGCPKMYLRGSNNNPQGHNLMWATIAREQT